jgi:hypothetical protein
LLISQLVGSAEIQHQIFMRPSGERVLRQIEREHHRDFEKIAVLDTVLDRRTARVSVAGGHIHVETEITIVELKRRHLE